jgi:hypothetical protein
MTTHDDTIACGIVCMQSRLTQAIFSIEICLKSSCLSAATTKSLAFQRNLHRWRGIDYYERKLNSKQVEPSEHGNHLTASPLALQKSTKIIYSNHFDDDSLSEIDFFTHEGNKIAAGK